MIYRSHFCSLALVDNICMVSIGDVTACFQAAVSLVLTIEISSIDAAI